ncbi:MAG: WD40 repeat domain-containing protein [Chloroflexota bacterium]
MKHLAVFLSLLLQIVLAGSVAVNAQAVNAPCIVRADRVTALAWQPDGSRIAVGTNCGVELYDDSFAEVALLPIQTENAGVMSIAWNSTGSLLAVAEVRLGLNNSAATTVIWDTRTNQIKTRLDTGSYTPIRWNPMGTEMVVGSYDGYFYFYDISSGIITGSVKAEHLYGDDFPNPPITTCWSADGKRLIAVFRWITYSVDLPRFEIESQREDVSNIADKVADCDSTGSRVATDWGSVVNLFTGAVYDPARTFDTSEGCNLIDIIGVAVGWRSDDKAFAVNCDDKTVRVYDSQAHLLTMLESGLTDSSGYYQDSIDWSPDGKLLGAAANDGKVRIWNTDGYHLITTINVAEIPLVTG